jgi:ubiquinol-cytochrome c reductase cytochrome b subunit
MAGISTIGQVFSGARLLINYNRMNGYDFVQRIILDVYLGWILKTFHIGNARLAFFVLYGHTGKNLSMGAYRLGIVWNIGVLIIFLYYGISFRGYGLLQSQISYWAVIVITRLVSVIPVWGLILLNGAWSGYRISWVTYQRLFAVHVTLPFVVCFIIVMHLNKLHSVGSTNLFFSHSGYRKVRFFPYYWVKDSINIVAYWFAFFLILAFPYALGEVELYEEANSLVSPIHILPEWYFLAQYAILRRVPSKGVGVMLILIRIAIYFFYPYTVGYVFPLSGISRGVYWWEWLFGQAWLRYLGIAPISQPYILAAQISVLIYFLAHLIHMGLNLIVTHFFQV